MTGFAPMLGAFGVVSIVLNFVLLAAAVTGLIASLRHRWLSDRIWLLVAGFAALAATAGIQVLGTVLSWSTLSNLAQSSSMSTAASMPGTITMVALGMGMIATMLVLPAAWACIAVGLALVLKDLREKISGLRGLLAEHEPQPGGQLPVAR